MILSPSRLSSVLGARAINSVPSWLTAQCIEEVCLSTEREQTIKDEEAYHCHITG